MSDSLVEKVKSAGVVGAGGAGFPAHVKYDAQVEYVIANGAECEPLLSCDQALMRLNAEKIVAGLRLVMQHCGARQGVIALKAKYEQAIEALRPAAERQPGISLHLLENFYPAGDEQVLTYEVTSRVVPEGGIPLHRGVIVSNVATLANTADAAENRPVLSRWLTVQGEVERPFTAEIPLGVSFGEVLSLAGGVTADSAVLISGGPMMGSEASPEDVVTKTTGGILVFSAEHPYIKWKMQSGDGVLRRAKAVCDQCMACTDLCPRYLLGHELKPHLLMRSAAYGLSDAAVSTSSFLCCECGVCSYYACPLFLSPSRVNTFLKTSLASAGVRNPHNRRPAQARTFRKERLLPVSRLVSRIGMTDYYHREAPVMEVDSERFASVRIPLKQHIGVPAEPVVRPGDYVEKGCLIGEIPQGKLGARIHASLSGRVMETDGGCITIRR